jgi:hypothetical protein
MEYTPSSSLLSADQIIQGFNQKNSVPLDEIHAALSYPRKDIVPELLFALKHAADNYQQLEKGDVRHIIAMYVLAQRRETEAFPYIMQLASLPREWPEELLGDILTEGLARLMVSTYNGDLKALQTLVEHTHANLYSRIAALHALIGLYAIGTLKRGSLVAYYRELVHSPLVQDFEFASWLIHYICNVCPQELYHDVMPLFDRLTIDTVLASRDYLQAALQADQEARLKEHVYSDRYCSPIDNAIPEIAWFYRPQEDDIEALSDTESPNASGCCADHR